MTISGAGNRFTYTTTTRTGAQVARSLLGGTGSRAALCDTDSLAARAGRWAVPGILGIGSWDSGGHSRDSEESENGENFHFEWIGLLELR